MRVELAPHLALWQRGERLAAEHLERLGYVPRRLKLPCPSA